MEWHGSVTRSYAMLRWSIKGGSRSCRCSGACSAALTSDPGRLHLLGRVALCAGRLRPEKPAPLAAAARAAAELLQLQGALPANIASPAHYTALRIKC